MLNTASAIYYLHQNKATITISEPCSDIRVLDAPQGHIIPNKTSPNFGSIESEVELSCDMQKI